jgi:dihydrofolate reductase
MAKLIYATNTSIDGYIEDATGSFDWSAPSEDLHRFFNDLVADCGAFLYGRRLYESMAVWETDPSLAAQNDVLREFAEAWQDADKVVYSRTLPEPSTRRTRIERDFGVEQVNSIKASADRDLLIGGAEIAAQALRAGVVDEYLVGLHPVIVGGGKPALPNDVFLEMELLDERRFTSGVVVLRYRIGSATTS